MILDRSFNQFGSILFSTKQSTRVSYSKRQSIFEIEISRFNEVFVFVALIAIASWKFLFFESEPLLIPIRFFEVVVRCQGSMNTELAM